MAAGLPARPTGRMAAMSVTIVPGREYLVDYATGKMWRPKAEHAGRPIGSLRKWEDFDFVGLTEQAAAAPLSKGDGEPR